MTKMSDCSEHELSESLSSQTSPEEVLLHSARTGNLDVINELFSVDKGCETVNINCKGKQKSNYGWTALHLASYFGHKDIVESLIKNGANVNVSNEAGDTALHKAAYTGREELVLVLLANNADVFLKNGEGKTAKDYATGDVKKLLKAVEEVDLQRREEKFLNAAREGDLTAIQEFLQGSHLPNINCVDFLGNTALHCAAYCCQKEAVVLLLQNGIDSTIHNKRGQLAVDLVNNEGMKQLLNLQPTRQMQKSANRFEGMLMRKNRFLGWRPVWTVLERGVISFFTSRADASTGTKRKGYKYLDGCKILQDENENAIFALNFSDGSSQRFRVPFVHYQLIDRQKWVNALKDHCEFATHYLKQGLEEDSDDDDEKDIIPLGTLRDALQTTQAQQQILDRQVTASYTTWQEIVKKVESQEQDTLSLDDTSLLSLFMQLKQAVESCKNISYSLSQCMTVMSQQEEARMLQLRQEQEKCRILEQALHVLAQEHHNLEQSMVTPHNSPENSTIAIYSDTDCEEFYDACDDDDDGTLTPVVLSDVEESKTATESEIFASFPSMTVSLPSTETGTSKWGRARLPVPMFPRSDFNVWSILKHCIGKELSKITMPIIFNEPLSFLQRIAESMEYSYLLQNANECDDPVKRIEFIAAYAVSSASSNWERLGKPFNPLLGETYEFCRDDLGLKYVAEQVSHHPPISAFHAQTPHFCLYGSIQPKLKFWGKSVEVKSEGSITLELLRHKEIYTWSGIDYCVHNIIVGKMWLEQYGKIEIVCHNSGLVALLHFKPSSWFGQHLHSVEGFIQDKKKKLRFLYGKWIRYVKSIDIETYEEYVGLHSSFTPPDYPFEAPAKKPSLLRRLSRVNSIRSSSPSGNRDDPSVQPDFQDATLLWKAESRPDYSTEHYNFTLFAMALNELSGTKEQLPPTDSRLRPDLRLLEEGDIDKAAAEKHRLEEKQREARKNRRKNNNIVWAPRWFEQGQSQYLRGSCWLFKNDYWKRDYSNCPDIF